MTVDSSIPNEPSVSLFLSLCVSLSLLSLHIHQKSSNILKETERMQGVENEGSCYEILVTHLRPAQNLGPQHFNINRERVLGVPTLAEELLLVNGCWRRSHFSSDI